MAKPCDNESTGIIIRDGKNFIAIKRKNFPVSIAFSAGHNDGDTPENTARKESEEEVSVDVHELKHVLKDTKLKNTCKREGGTWHNWNVYEATKWRGTPHAGSDAKEAFPITPQELKALADKTIAVLDEVGVDLEQLDESIAAVVNYPGWEDDPGFEPVWIVLLQRIGIL